MVLSLLSAAALAADPPVAPLDVPFERYTLDNGLDVILAPDGSIPAVHVNVWYHVGSADEVAGRTGFAHLFEHLMFQGSPSLPGEYFDALDKVGATVNGTTSFDRTNYFETVPSEYLPLALFVESDRMGWLLDSLDQSKLDNQREVVRNERRQRYENPPYGAVMADLMAAAWPADHPYHHLPIGSHEDLQAATLDDVKAFFRAWYTPDNASLAIVGDFDPEVAKELVQRYFGEIPSGPGFDREPIVEAPIPEDVEIVQDKDVPEAKVWLAWRSPALYDRGDAELDLLSYALTGGKEARLYHALVKDQRVAKDVAAYQQSMARGSLFVIQATAAEGHTTDEVVAAIDAVLADALAPRGLTVEDLDLARTDSEVTFYDRMSTISGKADALNAYNTYTGDPGWFAEDLARYEALSPRKVRRAARRVLRAHRVALHVHPIAAEGK